MKKKLGIFSVAIIAVAMILNANILNNTKSNSTNVDLASLIAINVANAEVILDGCRIELDKACRNGTVTVNGCDDTFWFENDNCPYTP